VSRGRDARDPRTPSDAEHRSQRHRLWEGLEGAEAFRALAEGVPAILYIDAIDEFSTTLYTSPQIGSILGYQAEEWLNRPSIWVELLHPEDRERVLALHEESNTRGEEFHAEYRLIARDGHEVWFRDEAVLVRDEQGAPLFWRGVMLDITEQKLAEERLRRSLDILRRTMQQRRVLVARLEEAQEEERRRIAGDIHDDPVQVMSAADLRIQTLAGRLDDPATSAALEEVHVIVENAIERLRNLLFELRPPSFGELGLAGALQAYLRHVGAESGFVGTVESRLSAEPPPEVAAILFRIAQEAITNSRKHARAARVDVVLEEREGGVAARVVDDGLGFEPSTHQPRPGHLGMSAMEERAELAGGWSRVDSAPGRGTVVEAWVPVVDSVGEGTAGGERSA
jgi:PAS domain S-box-containing protein